MNSKTGDPVLTAIVFIVLGVFALLLLLFVSVAALPVVAVAGLGYLGYRYYMFQKIKSWENVTATVKDRPHYVAPRELAQQLIKSRALWVEEEDTRQYSSSPLVDAFISVVTDLYAAESFNEPPYKPETVDQITLGKYYKQLEEWQRKVSDTDNFDVFLRTAVSSYLALREFFPPYALQPKPAATTSSLTTSLTLTDDEKAAEAVITEYWHPELKKRRLFDALREQIERNDEGQPVLSFATHFVQTPFKIFTKIELPILLPDETRFAGMWCIAPPGRGKTTLLHTLVNDDLKKDAAIVLMDSKGDLIEPIKNLAAIKDRLVLIEPDPDSAFALNPLDVSYANITQVVSLIEYIMAGLLDAKFTGLQSTLFRNVVPAIHRSDPPSDPG